MEVVRGDGFFVQIVQGDQEGVSFGQTREDDEKILTFARVKEGFGFVHVNLPGVDYFDDCFLSLV